MRFQLTDIRLKWDEIHESLCDTLHPSERVEEVYYKCRAKKAFLFLCEEGYIVVEELFEEPESKILHVWIAYGKGTNLLEKYNEDINQLAKSVGANKITFRTQRKGFERALPDGWCMDHIEYQKRVS